MNRCAFLAAACLALSLPAAAQMQRNFPQTALRGELRVIQPPVVQLNGRPARLAPGARIRGENNMLLMSGTVVGAPLVVNYTRDTEGNLLEIWVLTPPERTRQPWPATPEQAQAWAFDFSAQAWRKP